MHHQQTKQSIRLQAKALRKQVGAYARQEASKSISQKVIALKAFEASSVIFLYAPLEYEVETYWIFEEAIKQGKQVVYPKVDQRTLDMAFYQVTSLDQLEEVRYKSTLLKEPDSGCSKWVRSDIQVLMIVPGLAFDKNRYRMGYGGGFYDKYLATFKGVSIGICLEQQLFERLPIEEHDLQVDYVVTPQTVIGG